MAQYKDNIYLKHYKEDLNTGGITGENLPVPRTAKYLQVTEVVGKGSCECLLEFTLPFPDKYPAVEITGDNLTADSIKLNSCRDKVLASGLVHIHIFYKSYEGVCDIETSKQISGAFYGSMRYLTVSLPFSCYVNIPGVLPDDRAEVESADTDDGCKLHALENSYIASCSGITLYKSISSKLIFKITVSVLRNTTIQAFSID